MPSEAGKSFAQGAMGTWDMFFEVKALAFAPMSDTASIP